MINGYAITTENLSKTYKKGQVKALTDISLSIPKGGIYTILGPNGAGKTTFLRILGTNLLMSSGSATVLGLDVKKRANEIRKKIAVIPQEAVPLPYNTVWDVVYSYGRLRGLSKKESKKRTEETLNFLGLWDKRKSQNARLSGGLRRRVLLCMVMMADADIFLLDEPTTGLDPIARRNTWTAIRQIATLGKTVILTTHYMEEAEVLADKIAIINKGSIVKEGTVSELLSETSYSYKVYIDAKDLENMTLSSDFVVKSKDETRCLYTNNLTSSLSLVKDLLDKGVKVSISKCNLEDAYIEIIGETEHAKNNK